jgi:hypothetical protein
MHTRPIQLEYSTNNPFLVPPQQYVREARLYQAPTFRGEGDNVEQWIREIELLLSLQVGWTEAMEMAAVVPLLEGGARENFIHRQNQYGLARVRTWEQLKQFLRTQYYNEFEYFEALSKFERLRCRRGEERQFVAECQRLTPLLLNGISEHVLVGMIRDKVVDGRIRDRLYENLHWRLSDVFTFMLRMATSNEVMNRQRDLMPQARRPPPPPPRNSPPRYTPPRRQQWTPDQPRWTPPRRSGPLECFICQGIDHLRRDCPYRNAPRNQRQPPRQQPHPQSQHQLHQLEETNQVEQREEQRVVDESVENVASESLN